MEQSTSKKVHPRSSVYRLCDERAAPATFAALQITHVQYTQTGTNRQETLTNDTIGKKIIIRQRSLMIRTIGTNGNLLSPLVYHL